MTQTMQSFGRKKGGEANRPVKLYDTLDRAHDKGPLRPAQLVVLKDWYTHHQGMRAIIVKLHTPSSA